MTNSSLAWTDVKGGMNASDPPQSIGPNQVVRMVNCQLVNGWPTTRFGSRVIPLSGDAAEALAGANIQGSMFFNPAKGQGGLVLSKDSAMIMVAAGGRKYAITLEGRMENTTAKIKDVTTTQPSASELHTAWWVQAEDRAVCTDGQSPTWIWAPPEDAHLSPGYNVTEKEKSRVPNGATVMAYSHSRLIIVVNSRYILVSDNLFKTNQTNSKDLENFVEQTYWATGPFFLPPASVGNILAAATMASPGETNDGTGTLWFHLEDGLFPINLNVYPRSQWEDTPMVKTALEIPGAAGPYAVVILNGDQMFRSSVGVMSIQWALSQNSVLNPIRSMSPEVDLWLLADYPPYQRFCSMVQWRKMRRVFVTTAPIVKGRWRWHRGFISLNMRVTPTTANQPSAWEGLWTLHPQVGGVIQFVNGIFNAEERQFAWCRGVDGRNRLVEFADYLRYDVKEDGSTVPIPCQVITRGVDAGKFWARREYTKGRLYFRQIRGKITWAVWARAADNPEWVFWNAGTANNPITSDGLGLVQNEPRPLTIPLGKLPPLELKQSNAEGRYIQLLVRWSGFAGLENVLVSYGEKDLTDDNINPEGFTFTFAPVNTREYNDFEYYESEVPDWLDEINAPR